ncbi:beta-propeller domain-containing protein [Micromonosporaceae bacterium Da 78-11]
MPRRTWLHAVLAVLPLAGCTATSFTPQVRPTMKLVAYDSCGQLLTELRAAARQSVGPYGLPGGVPEVIAGGARTMMSDMARTAPAYSGTNVHEQGVDEPDIVKTDGRRIVTVTGGVLRVIDPATKVQTGRLDLAAGGQPEVLLAGDRALVLISDTGYQVLGRRYRPTTGRPEVLLVDLSGPPRLISRYHGSGTVIDARQTGGVARVVLSSSPAIAFPQRSTSDDGLLTENREAIDKAPVDAWLPDWEITTGTTTTKGKLDCGAVSRPSSFSGTSMLSVLTFDLGATALTDGNPVGVVTDGDTVYGTPTSLYVANNQRWRLADQTVLPPPNDTEIYRFDLPPTGKPVFTASGTVPGLLLNQYAMSEWDGDLRIATTDATENASAVRVLRAQNDKLVQIGEVSGLGKGERIYSVRFVGPRGYVVTFKQTDPLYSVDLSDPTRPQVTGELKITGYSGHLQPVGDNRLIGIGQEATGQGRPTGTQISLFDVADPANPRRLAQQQIRGAQSEAEYDPHALLWWPATKLLVVPMAGLSNDGALAVRVTDGGLETVGRIAQPSSADGSIRRTMVIGDLLWTLSDNGLQASELSTLQRVGWVPLT